jgi:hypothetical protein
MELEPHHNDPGRTRAGGFGSRNHDSPGSTASRSPRAHRSTWGTPRPVAAASSRRRGGTFSGQELPDGTALGDIRYTLRTTRDGLLAVQ